MVDRELECLAGPQRVHVDAHAASASPTAMTDSPSASIRALTSATGRSTSRSRNSVQKPNVDSSSMSPAPGRDCSGAARCAWSISSVRPVDHIQAPSRMTPIALAARVDDARLAQHFELRRRRGDRVAGRAQRLLEQVRQVAPAARRPSRRAAASRATVRMVPSTGGSRLGRRRRWPTLSALASAARRQLGASASAVGKAAQQLRQDDARVAARAQHRRLVGRARHLADGRRRRRAAAGRRPPPAASSTCSCPCRHRAPGRRSAR